MKSKKVTVFCGARKGNHPSYEQLAITAGTDLARRQCPIIYGGGSIGMMGALANAALANQGKVIGIITKELLDREVGHKSLTQMIVTDTLTDRKTRLIDQGEAFLVLPGGYGTLDELFEVVTWRQLGHHTKPLGLVNPHGFFDGLISFVNKAVETGFIPKGHGEFIFAEPTVERTLDRLLES